MNKKILYLLMAFSLLFPLFSVTVSASTDSDLQEVIAKVDKANAEIQLLIDEAIAEGEKLLANQDKNFESKRTKLIDKLVDKTNKIAQNAKEFGEKRGFTIECEWTYVEIAGKGVWIDPLRIVGC